ncbi:MAG: hypothetical protein RLZZ226_742 [Pseudomonadota bacterium]
MYAGTLVAAHLLRLARGPLQIHLIERDPTHFGCGVAYSTQEQGHLLNVPAANMSTFSYDPAHFLGWAEARAVLVANPPGPGRHRLAPSVADNLERLVASGQLRRHVGTITEYRESETAVEVAIRLRGTQAIAGVWVGAVVNCSGSDSNYRRLESALIRNLLEQGLIRPDPLALGLDVTTEGAVIGRDGKPSDRLYILGPPARGLSWKTTAVPEIRNEAGVWRRGCLLGQLLARG